MIKISSFKDSLSSLLGGSNCLHECETFLYSQCALIEILLRGSGSQYSIKKMIEKVLI